MFGGQYDRPDDRPVPFLPREEGVAAAHFRHDAVLRSALTMEEYIERMRRLEFPKGRDIVRDA